ncbi:AAA family ATPase [Myceligenerans pegani]|uniref:AAA family ATPase n=1 Tax=Myceligenerans pegani TaxID=2776917 RepID=A0ABR9MWT6_9MICO|nr:AAA family ATPase [Myceligenerans sp. TRM 65318]MBE1875318.1 AAA family ATPase [Myceligenerans sp. TRM 65318]MBE3017589.1 AAA family ATPase [Myceligenerans sp. TRM 65318]
MSTETVRSWPQIEAVVRTDGSGEVRIDGNVYPVVTGSLEEARIEVLRRVTENAIQVGRPVRASAEGPEGVWKLVVHPDGTVVPEEEGPTPTGATPVVAPEREPDPVQGAGTPGEGTAGAGTPGDTGTADTGTADTETTVPRIPASPPALHDLGPLDPTRRDNSAPNGSGTTGSGTSESPSGPSSSGPSSNGAAPIDTLPGPAGPADHPRPPTHENAPRGAAQDGVLPDDVLYDGARHDGAYPAATQDGAPHTPRNDAGRHSAPPAVVGSAPSAPEGVADWVREEEARGPEAEPGSRTRRAERASFLTQVSVEEPAEQGFRGWLTRMGLPVGPSEAERAERADERDVSQHWPGPRTISIVNGKGGAGKTPSSVLLSAVFAQFGGAGVVAWDNNQTRGTLGWRTEKGPHDATLLDLLPRADHLLGPSAQAADLARYVHHQTRDRYDVLRSKPMAMAHEQRIGQADVDAIHAVLSKYYRLIIIDSGNDESDPMWQRMIDHTDQLVVATTTRDDHAEAGALLLEGLAERDGRSAYLAQQAVVVVSQADQKAPAEEVRKVAAGYEPIAREVVTVPFDPGMVDGHLRYGALRPATRRAWLAAGAAVARGL